MATPNPAPHPVQVRISARNMLVTIFGYTWRHWHDHLPSGALVELMGDFGVSPANARATLSRMAREGLLESAKSGRNTFYRVAGGTVARVGTGTRRIASYGDVGAWDGTWTVVLYSIPEERRDSRAGFRDQLRREGFAPFYDGAWIAPGRRSAAALRAVEDLGVPQATVFPVSDADLAAVGRAPLESWDLDAIGGQLRELRDRSDAVRLRAGGGMDPAAALVERTVLMARYRDVLAADPGLPPAMMPPGWPRGEARAAFGKAFDALAPLAEARVREVLGRYGESLPAKVEAITTAELAEVGELGPELPV